MSSIPTSASAGVRLVDEDEIRALQRPVIPPPAHGGLGVLAA
ncbi:MAG: hypothetical protein ABIR34_05120 [Marmoricola sp.]